MYVNICDYCHKDHFLSLHLEFFVNFVSFVSLSREFHRGITGSLFLVSRNLVTKEASPSQTATSNN